MQGRTRGDIIASTLDYYRERTQSDHLKTPKAYKKIKDKLEKTKANGKRLLIDIKDSYSVQTIVVELKYVHDRWAMGTSVCYANGKEVLVPYTIHYSDIYCNKMNIKVIVEGERPNGT